MVTRPALIAPEIAERYGRATSTVQRVWTQHPEWPAPVGKRGRWNTYDAEQVDQLVRRAFLRDEPARAGDPDDLLTVNEIADYTGLSPATIRADISRDRWRDPDETRDGVKRWRRSSVDQIIKSRRSYRRNPSG
ncbi:hypothetical protein OHR68_43275 [Spirillospora sp. NBC_00431]